jgi:hypothetical protein
MHRTAYRVRITRRGLQMALGLTWLLDGALQCQPFMFSRGFATQVIAAAGPGNPIWIAGPVGWTAAQIAGHAVAANACFVTLELVLGLGIAWPRTTRLALAASIPWAIGVWWLGEGLGGIFAPQASPLTGSPGAVVLYAFVAVLLWPREPDEGSTAVAYLGPLRTFGAQLAWVALWCGLCLESVAPAYRPPDAVADAVLGMRTGEPGWLAAADRAAGDALLGRGAVASVLLAAALAIIAGAVLRPSVTRPVLVACALWSLLIWVVPENFGGIGTGSATDPGTGPLLVLLALAYWPRRLAAQPRQVRGEFEPVPWWRLRLQGISGNDHAARPG